MTSYGFANFVSDFIFQYCEALGNDFWDVLVRNDRRFQDNTEFKQLTHDRKPEFSNIEEFLKQNINYSINSDFSKNSNLIQNFMNKFSNEIIWSRKETCID